MKKGFTLIETLLYVTLLSFIMLGIFSSLFSYLHFGLTRSEIKDSDYLLLIKNFHEK